MKPGSISSANFALSCIAAAMVSGNILGPGMWGAIFLSAGLVVAAGPYYRPIGGVARAIALVAATLALLAVALGLLAGTTGGSFRLPDDQAFLLFLLFVIGVFGIAVHKTPAKNEDAT
jgi:hypothetical protein